MKIKFKPLADRLVVKPLEEEEVTASGIVLPETAKEKPMKGEVLSVGPGARDEDGDRIEMDVKVGDKILFAKEIELDDPYENMGAQLLKEAATKTNDIAGDGTTTSTVLAHAIVTEGLKNLAAGSNPMLLKHGIEKATDTVVEALRKMSQKIETKAEIASVATNSAQDGAIGSLIAEVMDKVGKDGVITVEE